MVMNRVVSTTFVTYKAALRYWDNLMNPDMSNWASYITSSSYDDDKFCFNQLRLQFKRSKVVLSSQLNLLK